MSIVLIGGSPAVPSSSSRLLLHIGERLAALGHRYQRLHVRDLPAPALLHADVDDPAIKRALESVADADAIVIATPVYQAAYTGLLKAFLDLLPQNGLAGKTVLPVATGGSQSHLLMLDYALRPVLQALGARHVLASVYATSQQLAWRDDAGLELAANLAERVADGVEGISAAVALAPGRAAAQGIALSAPAAAHAVHAAAPGIAPAAARSVRSLQDPPYAHTA